MKYLAVVAGAILLALAPFQIDAQQQQAKKSTHKVLIPKTGKFGHFIPRGQMRPSIQFRKAVLPNRKAVPPTPLPVDGSGNRSVSCPMYGNDQYGDCGEAMAAHTIGILSYAQGKRQEILYQDAVLIQQYLHVSGGDNGMDEDMEVGPQGVFTVGVGANPKAIAVSSMDVDPNDVQLVQYLLDQFYTLQLAWSVPDAFINSFQSGQSYLQPMRPNPANGHYTTISDVTKEGYYTLWTWGGWAQVSQSFVASVQPSYFVVFSPVPFDPATGFDSKGRHITQQAAVWVACGGNTIPPSVISQFPPATPPDPKAPYKLFEKNKKDFLYQVGAPLGYTDLPSAKKDAQSFATRDQKPVHVEDKDGINVATVKPGAPLPPAPLSVTIPSFTIPGQAITITGPLGRTYTGSTAPYTVPAQTVKIDGQR